MLFYQRGAEGDNIPETIIGRGPTTEPLVVEVSWVTLLFLRSDGDVTADLCLHRQKLRFNVEVLAVMKPQGRHPYPSAQPLSHYEAVLATCGFKSYLKKKISTSLENNRGAGY